MEPTLPAVSLTKDADQILKALSQSNPDSKLYRLYLKRIDYFRANPPGPAWNGLWVFTTK